MPIGETSDVGARSERPSSLGPRKQEISEVVNRIRAMHIAQFTREARFGGHRITSREEREKVW
jgi:hypothetical protein